MTVVRALGVVTASRRPNPAERRATGRHYDESRLSQPTSSARVESHVRVPMRDGVTLSTDIKRARTSLAQTGRRLMVGPWVHAIGRNPVGEAHFGPEASVDPSRVQLRWYDPADPVPTLGGKNCCWTDIAPTGPWGQRAAEQRSDVLVYTSREFQEPMEITGRPHRNARPWGNSSTVWKRFSPPMSRLLPGAARKPGERSLS